MPDLTLRNVPVGLYEALKRRAAGSRRSLSAEAIVCLEQVLVSRLLDPEETLAGIRAFGETLNGVYVTEKDLRAAKGLGRG